MESSLQNTSDRAIFECLAKSFIFGFIMGVNWDLFRPAPDGGCVKWKTTDATLFPHGRGMIKSLAHHALFKKCLERHTLTTKKLASQLQSRSSVPGFDGFVLFADHLTDPSAWIWKHAGILTFDLTLTWHMTLTLNVSMVCVRLDEIFRTPPRPSR